MSLPAELSRFVPRFETLFLSVKETDGATLTKTGHPFGWLLTVLQKEGADKDAISRALIEAMSHLNALGADEAAQRREAIWYFVSLILHRRPVDEHNDLITLVDRYTHDMEVKPMAQTMAEVLIEQGVEQGIEQGIEQGARQNAIQNILTVLNARFPQCDEQLVTQRLASIRSLERLTQLLRTAVQIPSFEAFLQTLAT